MENKDNENTEVVGNEVKPGEKLFTQEQVNEIVRRRLERQKETNIDARDLDTRSKELSAKESRLSCKEYLLDNGYSAELLDIIDTSDLETFKTKADKVSQLLASRQQDVIIAPLASTEEHYNEEPTGFERNVKHQPKGHWATDPRAQTNYAE